MSKFLIVEYDEADEAAFLAAVSGATGYLADKQNGVVYGDGVVSLDNGMVVNGVGQSYGIIYDAGSSTPTLATHGALASDPAFFATYGIVANDGGLYSSGAMGGDGSYSINSIVDGSGNVYIGGGILDAYGSAWPGPGVLDGGGTRQGSNGVWDSISSVFWSAGAVDSSGTVQSTGGGSPGILFSTDGGSTLQWSQSGISYYDSNEGRYVWSQYGIHAENGFYGNGLLYDNGGSMTGTSTGMMHAGGYSVAGILNTNNDFAQTGLLYYQEGNYWISGYGVLGSDGTSWGQTGIVDGSGAVHGAGLLYEDGGPGSGTWVYASSGVMGDDAQYGSYGFVDGNGDRFDVGISDGGGVIHPTGVLSGGTWYLGGMIDHEGTYNFGGIINSTSENTWETAEVGILTLSDGIKDSGYYEREEGVDTYLDIDLDDILETAGGNAPSGGSSDPLPRKTVGW